MGILRTTLMAAACIVLSAGAARGQYVQVVTVTVRPVTGDDYAEYLLRAKEAAERIGDPRTVSVYRPVLGGSPFRFLIVTSFEDFSERESWIGGPGAILQEAFGEDEAREIRQTARDVVESVNISVHALQPDFTSSPEAASPGQGYLRIVTTRVRPSGNDDYGAGLRATKAAEDKRGIKRNRWTRISGESFTHSATWSSDTLEGLAAPGPPAVLSEELGEVGEDLWARANAAVESRVFETWRYEPELSRNPM